MIEHIRAVLAATPDWAQLGVLIGTALAAAAVYVHERVARKRRRARRSDIAAPSDPEQCEERNDA